VRFSRYVTIVRFDPAYHTLFRCNLKMIRHDYPHIQKWLMHLYYNEAAFRETTYFDAVSVLSEICEIDYSIMLIRS
jgi:putative glutathione S-transferase